MSDYGTVLMVAWGMTGVTFDTSSRDRIREFQTMREQLRTELRTYGLTLRNSGPRFTLRMRRKFSGNKRTRLLHSGQLKDCCRRALSEIDPENYPLPKS